jgi:hypothetical protein
MENQNTHGKKKIRLKVHPVYRYEKKDPQKYDVFWEIHITERYRWVYHRSDGRMAVYTKLDGAVSSPEYWDYGTEQV